MNECMLTIIMSNYNQEKYIVKAIESILSQEVNFKYKLIITDDGTTKDNSIQIIKDYEKKYPEIIQALYNKENGGYLVNILRAKAITKTPYFCLLDADDYYTDTHYLQRGFDFLQNNPEYVVYQENVNYLYEDGSTKPFINPNEKSRSFDIYDYLNDNDIIVQTTGQFYRNVIYSKGIPQIVEDSIGTVSERSFEGDYDRYVMHMKYGKSYFNNQICGIYRVLSTGIWSTMPAPKQSLLHLQTFYDYNRYFENKYLEFFARKMYKELLKIITYIQDLTSFDFTESEMKQLQVLYNFISDNQQYVEKVVTKKKVSLIKRIKNFIKRMLHIA